MDCLDPAHTFSRKNSPPECNYEIHDKELLAIICCLKEWESELNSVEHFTIITDHKNLRYFTTLRRLNERQMRWADVLSRYSFTLEYRPGKLAARPDALSRREQDMPAANDERLKFREKRLFDPETFSSNVVHASPVRIAVNVVTRRMAAKNAKRTSKSSSQNELKQSEQEKDSPMQAPNQSEREEDSQVIDGEWSDQTNKQYTYHHRHPGYRQCSEPYGRCPGPESCWTADRRGSTRTAMEVGGDFRCHTTGPNASGTRQAPPVPKNPANESLNIGM